MCILRNSRPAQQTAGTLNIPPANDGLAQSIREAVAEALPQFAIDLLRYNIKFGIRVSLSRPSTKKDATNLKSSLNGVSVVYFKAKEVVSGFNTSDDLDATVQRMKISKDGDKHLSDEVFTGPKSGNASLLPIVLGEPTIDLDDGAHKRFTDPEPEVHAPKRTRPSSPAGSAGGSSGSMDVDDAKTIEDRVTDLETGLGDVGTKVGQIENKIDAAISSKIELKAFPKADQVHPNAWTHSVVLIPAFSH